MSDFIRDMANMKRDEIIEYYSKRANLPANIIEQVYSFLEHTDDKTLKKMRKGQYKFKQTIERPTFKNGETIKGAISVQEGLSKIEEVEEKEI